ncbi:GDSL family lipase [Streptomyces sp. NPDC093801]|uniref:GDSL family lipase n=1 Tax=Streptomyces sp. NPDC093801 TaxID=3155203 RepID=UPI003450A9BA
MVWRNTAHAGDKVGDLEARWRADVLDARPDLVSVLVGVDDTGWRTLDPAGHVIPPEEFEATYDRLLAPLAGAGTQLVLVEPFLLPVEGVVEAGEGVLAGAKERGAWRTDPAPKIQVVRRLAHRYGAHLPAAVPIPARVRAGHQDRSGVTTGPWPRVAASSDLRRMPSFR